MARDDPICPVCTARLQGSRFAGYNCGKCHAHFSARFIAQMRRREFRLRIEEHFAVAAPSAMQESPGPVQEERIEVRIQDRERVRVLQEVLDQAHIAVQHVTRRLEHVTEEAELDFALEDILGGPPSIDEAMIAKKMSSSEAMVMERASLAAGKSADAAHGRTVQTQTKQMLAQGGKTVRHAKPAKQTMKRDGGIVKRGGTAKKSRVGIVKKGRSAKTAGKGAAKKTVSSRKTGKKSVQASRKVPAKRARKPR